MPENTEDHSLNLQLRENVKSRMIFLRFATVVEVCHSNMRFKVLTAMRIQVFGHMGYDAVKWSSSTILHES